MRGLNKSMPCRTLAFIIALVFIFASLTACAAGDAAKVIPPTEDEIAAEKDIAREILAICVALNDAAAQTETAPEEKTAATETAAPAAPETATKPAETPAAKSDTQTSKEKSPTPAPAKTPEKKPAKADDPAAGTITVTIAIDCKLLYDDDPDLASNFSTKGVMLSEKSVTVKKDATVLDVLNAAKVDHVGTTYIKGIMGLSEKDVGAKSGWCYSINGVFPSLGVTKATVKDGDKVAFRYSLNNDFNFGG